MESTIVSDQPTSEKIGLTTESGANMVEDLGDGGGTISKEGGKVVKWQQDGVAGGEDAEATLVN